ncbi:hypothetical protein INT47_005680 [Mucor saturninus]|uniref:Uncharacterized protein n=1 Tax=Mucor saturninus TaxID=64648 RepID=A0A8H7QS58_9FUNG|nr:hypothetical protein INT47_005680 [Mucor saturninus]
MILNDDLTDDLEGSEVSTTPCPPSQIEFTSNETLKKYVIDHCKENGYLVGGRSRYYPDRRLKFWSSSVIAVARTAASSPVKKTFEDKTHRLSFQVGDRFKLGKRSGCLCCTLLLNNSGHNQESADSLAGHSIAC